MKEQDKVIEAAKKILKEHPDGVRFNPLAKLIKNRNEALAWGTITGTLCKLEQLNPSIIKPEKGLFQLVDFTSNTTGQTPNLKTVNLRPAKTIKEKNFYKPFAYWIVNELDECTKAEEVGGSIFKDKWGTPDVIGIKESRKTDILKFPTQLIAAEIKTDANNLITAFGQACAYKLFSHKSYLVIPRNSGEDDLARMESLSLLHGIGLIRFNNDDPDNPEFEIRNRAIQHEPDLFYTNRYVRILAENNTLFD